MSLAEVTLDDKYVRRDGRVYLTGSQALVRLAIVQAERDRDNGLNTACLVSGYRGSPMHNVDREFWRAGALVEANNIQFQPAVNEDLARRQFGAANRRSCTAITATTAYSGFGTVRGRASTAASMPSATPIWLAPRRVAASWWRWVTTRR